MTIFILLCSGDNDLGFDLLDGICYRVLHIMDVNARIFW